MTFRYDTHLTDRQIQVVCAAAAPFHGSAGSSGGTSQFNPMHARVRGSYAERFSIVVDVDHARLVFHVVPGWGNPQRLVCRVYRH